MTITRITFNFFQKSGIMSRLVRTESIELEGVSKADLMKKDGSDVKKRFRLAIITAMNITPEEWNSYDYHTIKLNEREEEAEEDTEEGNEE